MYVILWLEAARGVAWNVNEPIWSHPLRDALSLMGAANFILMMHVPARIMKLIVPEHDVMGFALLGYIAVETLLTQGFIGWISSKAGSIVKSILLLAILEVALAGGTFALINLFPDKYERDLPQFILPGRTQYARLQRMAHEKFKPILDDAQMGAAGWEDQYRARLASLQWYERVDLVKQCLAECNESTAVWVTNDFFNHYFPLVGDRVNKSVTLDRIAESLNEKNAATLEVVLNDPDPKVRQVASCELAKLTGKFYGYDPNISWSGFPNCAQQYYQVLVKAGKIKPRSWAR